MLHYIYDPFCGWCYGAAPLVKAAREVLPVQGHGGGMMAGPYRQRVSAELRGYVLPHDARIAQLTGQPFGEAYAEGLLRDTTAVFDSEQPIAAILAAEDVAACGLDLLARSLLSAAALIENGGIDKFVQQRYAKWEGDLGRKIHASDATLASISDAAVAANINPKPQSGCQEMLENMVNRFI